jgi:hypothetical protein
MVFQDLGYLKGKEGSTMLTKKNIQLLFICMVVSAQTIWADLLDDAVAAMAFRVQEDQIGPEGLKAGAAGSWPGEEYFTGAIVNGMLSAYNMTSDPDYSKSAWDGAVFMHGFRDRGSRDAYNYYGDGALAYARFGQMKSEEEKYSIWEIILNHYYDEVESLGTEGYLAGATPFEGEASSPVYYLAHYAQAAYIADTRDKAIWRQGLIQALARVTDESAMFPVMAMGAATWALAMTGPLDEILVDPHADTGSPWNGVTLADLPIMLLSHQVPEGGFDQGSFFWRFDHGDGGGGAVTEGYTEDTIFGTLGLLAAYENSEPSNLDGNGAALEGGLLAAAKAILSSFRPDGAVYEHLSIVDGGIARHVYAGEMLFLLEQLGLDLSLDLDGIVNTESYADLQSVPVE